MMLMNHARASWNAIRSTPFSYAFGVLGLALSFAFFVLAMGYVQFESQYDRWVPDYERVYRVEVGPDQKTEMVTTPFSRLSPLSAPNSAEVAAERLRELPSVEQVSLARKLTFPFEHGGRTHVPNTLLVDGDFLNMMSVRFVAGELDKPKDANTRVALSVSLAEELFGDPQRALGQVLKNVNPIAERRDQQNVGATPYQVVAVFADWRTDSHLAVDALVMMAEFHASSQLFLKLSPGFDRAAIEAVINDAVVDEYFRMNIEAGRSREQAEVFVARTGIEDRNLSYRPIAHIHLQSDIGNGLKLLGDANRVASIRIAAFVLLILGSINFAGLLATRSSARLHEFAVRKVSGAGNHSLAAMAFAEVAVLALIAAAIAAPIVDLLQDPAQSYLDTPFELDKALSGGLWLWLLGAFSFIVVIGAASPILSLYRLQPSAVFGGLSRNLLQFRPLVVAFIGAQVALTVLVLIAVLTVSRQLQYVSNVDFGADIDNVYHVYPPLFEGRYTEDRFEKAKEFESRLQGLPGVDAIAFGDAIPAASIAGFGTFVDNREDNEEQLTWASLGPGYFDFYDVPLLAGRSFDEPDFKAAWRFQTGFRNRHKPDSDWERIVAVPRRVLVNVQSLRQLGIESPNDALGHVFASRDLDSSQTVERPERYEIVGVVPNLYHDWQYGEASRMAVYAAAPRAAVSGVAVRVHAGARAEFEQAFERLHEDMFPEFRQQYPGTPIRSVWADDTLDAQLEPERKRQRLFLLVAGLVLFIAALGLYDAVQFTASAQRREMAIRKVFGASANSIVKRVLWFFLLPVLLANLVAWPLAYWLMDNWLANYSTRIDLGLTIFLVAALISVAVTLLTVGKEAARVHASQPSRDLLPLGAKG